MGSFGGITKFGCTGRGGPEPIVLILRGSRGREVVGYVMANDTVAA